MYFYLLQIHFITIGITNIQTIETSELPASWAAAYFDRVKLRLCCLVTAPFSCVVA